MNGYKRAGILVGAVLAAAIGTALGHATHPAHRPPAATARPAWCGGFERAYGDAVTRLGGDVVAQVEPTQGLSDIAVVFRSVADSLNPATQSAAVDAWRAALAVWASAQRGDWQGAATDSRQFSDALPAVQNLCSR